jgi:hypothetical protein
MYSFANIAAKTVGHFAVPSKLYETETERHFCPGMSCLTDEVLVKPLSEANGVWVLTDQTDGSSWLTRGNTPTCPACGAKLIPAQ